MFRPDDPIERAHLRDARGFSPPVHRYPPQPGLGDVVRRYWLPVWSLPPGAVTVQRVLQYPVCLMVVAADYATFNGPTSGLSTRELRGSGWAAGVMLQPAAGQLLLGEPVSRVRDGVRPLPSIPLATDTLIADVRAAMSPDPSDPARHRRAMEVFGAALAGLLPVDAEGRLVNQILEYIENDSAVLRVGQVTERFGIGERSLERLTRRRIGMGPKWLIQRRRLHEAAERLRAGRSAVSGRGAVSGRLAEIAAELGYADQAHFSRDFRTVTGLTPGAFAAEPPPTDRLPDRSPAQRSEG